MASDFETIVVTCLTNPRVGMQMLNAIRVADGEQPHPANYGPGDLTRPHDSEWRAALASVVNAPGALDA